MPKKWVEVEVGANAPTFAPDPCPPAPNTHIIKKAGRGLKSFTAVMVLMFLGGNAFIINHLTVRGNTLVFEYEMSELEKTIFCKTMETFIPDLRGC